MSKIIYEDDGRDKAITGTIDAEDDLFFEIIDQFGNHFRIRKTRIVLIKEGDNE
jgi:hypothetical protein